MTMTNEQLDEAVKRIAWLDSKICEAIAAIDAGYSERKNIEWERAEANLCNEARAMAKIIAQLWDEREKQRAELRNALYPGGIKHPQQAEWPWLIERAKEQREALVKASEKLTSRALDMGDHYWIPLGDYEEAVAAIDAVL